MAADKIRKGLWELVRMRGRTGERRVIQFTIGCEPESLVLWEHAIKIHKVWGLLLRSREEILEGRGTLFIEL